MGGVHSINRSVRALGKREEEEKPKAAAAHHHHHHHRDGGCQGGRKKKEHAFAGQLLSRLRKWLYEYCANKHSQFPGENATASVWTAYGQ